MDYFSPLNTTVRVEGGKVVEINRIHLEILDEDQDYRLAETRPVSRRISDYKTCHADGGGGGKRC